MAPPFKEAEFDIIYGEGISKEGSVIDLGVKFDVVDKSGAWFSYNGQKIGQGRDNARLYLKENPEVFKEIDDKIRAIVFSEIKNAPAADDEGILDNDLSEADDEDILGLEL